MLNSVMPQGVKHSDMTPEEIEAVEVSNSVMPQGVKHSDMTPEEIEAIEQAIKAQRSVHWTWAERMLGEIRRLRVELIEVRGLLAEQLHEEQEG